MALTPGIGSARLDALLAACGTPLGALAAPFEFLRTIPGFSRATATALAERTLADGEAVLAATTRLGALALLPHDPFFPAFLREIPDPPSVLFALGRVELLLGPRVAMVGSRDHSAYGAQVCRMLAAAAAQAGITVVSGMARGLDAVAHEAALDAGGSTTGILGNGLGVVYPAANAQLYERVAREGLLLTELPPGERPFIGSFPRRNRLISGLSRVTVVIEAAHGSGALITAGTALEQGLDVMAVPGPITSATSTGTNALIRDGAEPLLAAADLLAHYPETAEAVISGSARTEAAPVSADAEPPISIPPTLAPIAACLGADLLHIDAIALASGRPPGECLAALAELELIGAAEQWPGGHFRRGGGSRERHWER